MGNLKAGDRVFDETGAPCNVVFAHDIMYGRPCYRVKFSDHSEIIADEDHLWQTTSKAARKVKTEPNRTARPSVVTTKQIADSLIVSGGENNHAIPLCGPLQYPLKDLSIDPYILGLWLGDGTTNGGSITIGKDDQPEILKQIKDAGYPIKAYDDIMFGLTNGSRKFEDTSHSFQASLRSLGVLGNKHIPEIYKEASIDQRLALLQGLMDSDGYVDVYGSCEFTSVSSVLAWDTYDLMCGLGFKPTMGVYRAKLYGRDVGEKYRIHLNSPDMYIFRLQRKKDRQRLNGKNTAYRFIVSVDPIESVPVRCITVDSKSSLYLVGKQCIPTHNTYLSYRLALQTALAGYPVGFFCPTYSMMYDPWNAMYDLTRPAWREEPNKTLKVILLQSGGSIQFISADKGIKRARGKKFKRVILDEAAAIANPESYNAVIRPTLSDYHGDVFMFSTPKGRNWFWEEFNKGINGVEGYKSFHFTSYEGYLGQTEEGRKEFDDAKLTMPEHLYREEILAEFTDSGSVVFKSDTVLAALTEKELLGPIPGHRYGFGVDWGRSNDYTVISIFDLSERRQVAMERFNKIDYEIQKERLVNLAKLWQPENILSEINNMGGPIFEALALIKIPIPYKTKEEEEWAKVINKPQEWRYMPMREFKTTVQSKQPLIDSLNLAFERHNVRLLDNDVIKNEMLSYELYRLPNGGFTFSNPPGGHDDTVISIALGLSLCDDAVSEFANTTSWSKLTFNPFR